MADTAGMSVWEGGLILIIVVQLKCNVLHQASTAYFLIIFYIYPVNYVLFFVSTSVIMLHKCLLLISYSLTHTLQTMLYIFCCTNVIS